MDTLKKVFQESDDFSIVLIPYFAQAVSEEGISDRLCSLRLEALRRLYGQLLQYKGSGYDQGLLASLAKKKAEHIMQVKTKTEMDRVIHPRTPHFNGEGFVPDSYMVPEEELICWSEASLRAPLNEYGMRRYMELFRQVFPEKSRELNL